MGNIEVELASSAARGVDCFPLAALPRKFLPLVLSHTSPCNVGRLTAVNKAYAKAAKSDLVWRKFLPANVDEIVRSAHGGPLVYASLKDLYNRLVDHVTLRDGTEGIWIDRKTGGVCRSYSARKLQISWGDNAMYWAWGDREGSRFKEVAYLKRVCWFDLSGEMRGHLPAGRYTVSWILQFDYAKSDGWGCRPVSFSMTDRIRGHVQSFDVDFPLRCSSPYSRHSNDNWWEHDVGQIDINRGELGEINVEFSAREIETGSWKSGVYFDGVVIRPSSLIGLSAQAQIEPAQEAGETSAHRRGEIGGQSGLISL